ncbi:YceD family protein [Hydrogenophaga sp. NFH-34]|uniref:YceD family protein n=1 Tax=Hydrogenophaga sp. NFH-34 TaxID=2744446 RepID=UPI001F4791F0|nr:DUF177 domain-containing protein [Hydrogenophaga sp. NFH-34]
MSRTLPPMKKAANVNWNPQRLDVAAFAQAGGTLSGDEPLAHFDRLVAESAEDATRQVPVSWSVQGDWRAGPSGVGAVWLHLQAQAQVPVTCQRCLKPVVLPLGVDRWFRFVDDEATAAAEDEDSDEDVLALEPRPNLLDLMEDELLMELPLVPMHEVCPGPVVMSAGDLGADAAGAAPAEAPNPFAALADLKKR